MPIKTINNILGEFEKDEYKVHLPIGDSLYVSVKKDIHRTPVSSLKPANFDLDLRAAL